MTFWMYCYIIMVQDKLEFVGEIKWLKKKKCKYKHTQKTKIPCITGIMPFFSVQLFSPQFILRYSGIWKSVGSQQAVGTPVLRARFYRHQEVNDS